MAQFGRALRSGRRGRRFKSCRLDWHTWSVGQAVKTPPSHGGNRGSIPLSAAKTLVNTRVFLLPFGSVARAADRADDGLRLRAAGCCLRGVVFFCFWGFVRQKKAVFD